MSHTHDHNTEHFVNRPDLSFLHCHDCGDKIYPPGFHKVFGGTHTEIMWPTEGHSVLLQSIAYIPPLEEAVDEVVAEVLAVEEELVSEVEKVEAIIQAPIESVQTSGIISSLKKVGSKLRGWLGV